MTGPADGPGTAGSAPDRFRERLRHNVPARIAPYAEANRAYPRARERERRLLIERLDPRPGGTVVDAMADVQHGTPAARWLNGPVNHFSDVGHAGRFPQAGALSQALHDAGFAGVEETLELYTWDFPDLAAVVWFCKRLFRLSRADEAEVRGALLDTLQVTQDASGAHLGWGLVHASGVRAH